MIDDRGRHPPHRAGRALIEAHPVLISDGVAQTAHRETDGAHAVWEAIVEPRLRYASTRQSVAGFGSVVHATNAP